MKFLNMYAILLVASLCSNLSADVIHITSKQDFQNRVLQNSLPVVVKFSAQWCPPCQAFAPVFNRTSQQFSQRVLFVDIDVDALRALAQEYNVRSLPTVIFFKQGNVKKRVEGALKAQKLQEEIQKNFGL